MDVILFEDQSVQDNYPATLARPAFAITCGVSNLYDLVRGTGVKIRTMVRAHLAATAERRFPGTDAVEGPILFVNAAVVPDGREVRKLIAWAGEGDAFLVPSGRRVAAAFLPGGPTLGAECATEGVTPYLLEQKLPLREPAIATMDYPFDAVRHHLAIFEPCLTDLIEQGGYSRVTEGVYAGRDVKIARTAVLKAEDGPIVLGDNVTIMDFAYLSGPLHVGPNSRIIERSSVKEDTCIGATCKIGGEVEASIIEDYSNKQHHGFLGHAHVGSWVNLGAGTSNSDLKNTYGKVRVQVGRERIDTGMQFFGCVIGDYSKSAINTSILTGKIIGVSSMLYGFVAANVPSFCNYARSFGQVTEVAVETAIEAQRRMFARRKVVQTPADVDLMRAIHAQTRDERVMATEQVSF